jgi:hypothetical protein
VELVCTGGGYPTGSTSYREWWCPARPRLGAAERTRFSKALDPLEWPLKSRLRTRIEAICRETRADVLHAVAHGTDFSAAREAARRCRLPFVLSAHDDLRYALRGRPDRALALRTLGSAWRDADARIVISDELGDEYNRRYGHRSYAVVTDGLSDGDIASRPNPVSGLRVYFAGLFHLAYGENLRALLLALESMTGSSPTNVTFRSGALPGVDTHSTVPVTVLPFGSERDVASDLNDADLLYLPMPFQSAHSDFVHFSLSTKLVTYLGSGRPILYHGPPYGAAFRLLQSNEAAIMLTSLRPDVLQGQLEAALSSSLHITENALRLARSRFRIGDQRDRFWSSVATRDAVARATMRQPA